MKKLIIFFFMLFGLISFANAINYSNISFTDEEFYSGSLIDTKVIELSNGNMAVGYLKGTTGGLKICNATGQDCSSENAITGTINDLDLFEDTTNNKIIVMAGKSSNGEMLIYNLNGTYTGTNLEFNTGETGHVSGNKINSTHFTVFYQDIGASNNLRSNTCLLNGSSCASEINNGYTITNGIETTIGSDDKIKVLFSVTGSNRLLLGTSDLDGTSFSLSKVIQVGGVQEIDIAIGSDGEIKIVYRSVGESNYGYFVGCDVGGGSCDPRINYNAGTSFYNQITSYNDLLFISFVNASQASVITMDLEGGDISPNSDFNIGYTSSYFSSIITSQARLITSYFNDSDSKGMFAVSEDLNSAGIFYQSPTQGETLNTTTFLLNVTFFPNVTASYTLNGGSNISLGENITNASVFLTGIEGNNNLTVYALSDEGVSSNSINFTIDTTAPIINETLPSEINIYEIDFSSYITIIETNPYTCIVEVVGQSNTTCDDTSYTFATNGNKTINIYVNDSAGHTTESLNNIILVNPSFTIQARDNVTNILLSDWDLGSYSTTTTNLSLNIYDLGIGNSTLEFVKLGYNKYNHTITITNTTTGIITIYNNPVTLFAQAYDADTLDNLTFDVQIKNSTDVVTLTGLQNLSKLYNEIPTGDLEMTFSATGYSDALFYTTITPFTSVTFDVYLTPENISDIVTFTLTDINTRQFLSGVLIEARRSIGNDTITVQQTLTGDSGLAYLILDTSKTYEFVFSKDGYAQSIISSIPTVNSYNVRLTSDAQNFDFLNGVNARFFPQTGLVYQNATYNFTSQIVGNAITRLEYRLLTTDGTVIDSLNTTNPTGATFITNFMIPIGYNQSEIIAEVKVYINGEVFTHSNSWRVAGVLGGTLKDLKEFGQSTDEEFKLLKFFIVIVTFVIVIVIGNRNPITRDFVSMLALLPTIIFTYIGWIPLLYGTVITVALFVLYLGGNKR